MKCGRFDVRLQQEVARVDLSIAVFTGHDYKLTIKEDASILEVRLTRSVRQQHSACVRGACKMMTSCTRVRVRLRVIICIEFIRQPLSSLFLIQFHPLSPRSSHLAQLLTDSICSQWQLSEGYITINKDSGAKHLNR